MMQAMVIIENIERMQASIVINYGLQEVKPKYNEGSLNGDENVKFRVKCPFYVQNI